MKIYHSFWDYGYRELTKDLYNMHKLSALLALENYGNIHLITTEKGKIFLRDIPYTSVSIFNEEIDIKLKETWSISKIYAYKQILEKQKPFLHIDYDVFLFKKLPKWVDRSEVIVQHLEDLEILKNFYNIKVFEKKCPNLFLYDKNIKTAANMGIFGGNNLEAINFYVKESLKLVNDVENKNNFWLPKNIGLSYHNAKAILLEQFYLINCLKKINVIPTPLFEDLSNGWPKETDATKYGYTHLLGSKGNLKLMKQIENTISKYENSEINIYS